MTATMVTLGDETARLIDCDWVLWASCGCCPRGVASARAYRTADAAWLGFFETWKNVARVMHKEPGLRLELMTHDRYAEVVMPLWKRPCPAQTPFPDDAG